jgi:hypothetical protein
MQEQVRDKRGVCEFQKEIPEVWCLVIPPNGGQHKITADVEIISIQKISEALARLLNQDVN